MSLPFPRSRRFTGGAAFVAALALGVIGGMLNVIPVASQVLTLEAARAPAAIDAGDPWASVWDRAPRQEVPLSAQNVAPPFGGGAVSTLVTRAFFDDDNLFLLLEWPDAAPNDTVTGEDEFADAAAVQFPGGAAGSVPPFTMGGAGASVNIWQWKALWQADIERGFDTVATRYPNTYVDLYPGGDDPLNKPALHVGNPLSVRDHDSPIENLIAEGFGTLTHSDVQDVDGSGAWRDGRWRALFVRSREPAAEGLASFEPGVTTSVAFAVWDGAAGDRNGLKSIAPWIELTLGPGAAPGEPGAVEVEEDGGGVGGGVALILLFGAIVAVGVGAYLYTLRQRAA